MYWNNVNECLPKIDQPCFLWDGRRMWIGCRTFDADNCVWAWSNSHGGIEWNGWEWATDKVVDRDYQPTYWMALPKQPRFMNDAAVFEAIASGANGDFGGVDDGSYLAEALTLLRIRLPEDTSPARIRAICCQLLEIRSAVEAMMANIPRHCRMSGLSPVLFSNHPSPPEAEQTDFDRGQDA